MKKTPLVLTVLNFVLIAVAIVAEIFVAIANGEPTPFEQFSIVLAVIAALSSLAYLFGGASKNEAEYYKAFALCFALSALFGLLVDTDFRLTVGLCAIAFGLILTIGLSKNLGKGMSIALCVIILALYVILFIVGIARDHTIKEIAPLSAIASVATAGILLLDTLAKYVDKFNRYNAPAEEKVEETPVEEKTE